MYRRPNADGASGAESRRRLSSRDRFLAVLFSVAVAINFVWEMVQMPLYENMPWASLRSWLLCFRASLGDGVIVLFIWLLGALLYRRRHWFRRLTPGTVGVLLIAGAAIAVGIEVHALAVGRWSYSQYMPLVPPLGVGLSPFVQLLLLPWICMKTAHSLITEEPERAG
jgi:hypothetical protein